MTRHGEDIPPRSAPPGERARDSYGRGVSPFRPAARRPLLHRLVPVSERLAGYGGGALRRDLLAGVTVAALALPAAMAYGELAGLSAVAGLYALLLPTVAYTVFGSSRQLIVGPDGSIAALVAAAVVPLAAEDPQRAASLAALLALLVGAVFLVARLIRLGWVADYFSRAVLIGYLHGVAVVLVIGQLGKLFGLTPEAEGPIPTLAGCSATSATCTGSPWPSGPPPWPCCSACAGGSARSPGPWSWWWPRSSPRPPSTWPPTAWPWSARSPRACPASSSPASTRATRWRCSRRPLGSSSSATPTRS